MPSPTDFNLSPYYDDFAESKKFHRILFRPSFAVQARELTQSQSILQPQLQLPFQLKVKACAGSPPEGSPPLGISRAAAGCFSAGDLS